MICAHCFEELPPNYGTATIHHADEPGTGLRACPGLDDPGGTCEPMSAEQAAERAQEFADARALMRIRLQLDRGLYDGYVANVSAAILDGFTANRDYGEKEDRDPVAERIVELVFGFNEEEEPDGWTGSWCPEHGPGVNIDEDGCCMGCGTTAVGAGAEIALSLFRTEESQMKPCEANGPAGEVCWLEKGHTDDHRGAAANAAPGVVWWSQ